MMTREHHRRRSPETSRRRRKERRNSREQLQIQPVSAPLPLTRYEEHDEHQEERSRAFSPLSSSSSTSSSLLNISRPSQRFGLGRFFGGGQKQHRVKKKRRFLKFGNSSSSSVGSDLAYGKGYIEKGRSRELSPTSSHGRPPASRRSQTDEEILELGRRFAEIARQQNAEDLRAAGRSRPSTLIGAASALSHFRRTNSGNSNRGVGSSKPRRDSSPDDSEWESASDDDDSSSSEFDSGLAYGSGLSLQASAAPPPPQSPKSPMSPPRLLSSPRSLFSPHRSPPPPKKPSVVDPNLFGPVNSLRGHVETPCGFDNVDRSTVGSPRRPYEPSIPPSEVPSEVRPLQRLYPVPTSDPSNFDVAGSVVSSQRDFPTRSRPAPVPIQPPPLQQPRPIAPVSRKVLDSVETDSRYSERSVSKTAIGEAAVAGIAGAAIGAALSSDRRDDRDKRESRRDRDGKRRSKRSDAGVQDERTEKRKSREDLGETREVREERIDRRREKRSEPDRESERERHWREKIVPELKRESEEKRRRDDYDSDHDHDNVRDKREDERNEDREVGRKEIRKEENRDGRRVQDRTTRSTAESYKRLDGSEHPPREGPIDPFQFQVADDAFPTPLYTTPKRPLTPNVVTVDREPDFSRFEYQDDTHTQERLSRRDSYERELRDAHDVYEATEHATAPVSGAAFAAATAAVLAEERRGRSHSRGGDASSRNRSRRAESPKREKDTVLEDANRYYREAELARRIKEEDERSRTSAESSVVDKWKKSERKKPAVEIVQPPEMDHPKKKSPYDGPDADVRIDNVLQHPQELSRFRVLDAEGLSEPPLFKVRDPSAERERPMLNIVRPTPTPSPMPEERSPVKETPSDPTKDIDTTSSRPTFDAVTESQTEAPPAPPTPKVVSWGENQTKHYVVESPEREDDPFSGAKIVTPAKTPRARRKSAWERITAAIGSANDEVTSSGVSDRAVDTDPTKARRASEGETSRRSAEIQSAYDNPPVPGPKPSSLRGVQIPGSFAEDPAFTANIAAALQGSGFDPNIVIDDASFHRRESPPGSNESGVYQSPSVEPVTDSETIVAPRPAVSRNDREHGFIIGEVSEPPSDEKDIPTDNSQTPSEPSRKERRKQEKIIERDEKPKTIDDSKPTDTSRSSVDDDWDPASGKLSKKERKRRERAARAQSLDDGIALDDASRKDQELEAEFMGAAAAADEEESSSLKKKSKKSKRAVIVQEAPKQPDSAESSKVVVPVDAFQDIQDAKDAERSKITIPVNAYQDVQDAKTVQLDDKWDLQKSKSEPEHDPEIYDLLPRSESKAEHPEVSTRDFVENKTSSIPDEERDSPRTNSRRSKRDSEAHGSPSRPAPLSELSMESSYRVVDTDSIPATEEEWDTPKKSKKKSKRDVEIFGSPSRSALVSEPSIEIVRKDTLPDAPFPEDDRSVFTKRGRRGTIDDEFVASPSQSIADWNSPKESRKSKLDSVVYDSPSRMESSEDIVESPKEMTAPFSDWRSEKATVTEEEPSTPKKSKKKSKRESTIHEELPSTPVSRPTTPSVSSLKKSKRDSGVFGSPSRSSDVGAESSPKKGKKKKRPTTPGDFPEDDDKPAESEPPDRGKDQVEVSDRDISSILSDSNRYDDQQPGKSRARFDVADDDKSITSIPAIERKDRKDSKLDKDKKSGENSSFFSRFRSSIKITDEKERPRKSEEDKKNSFLDNADTLGAGVGSKGVAITPSSQESRSNAINAPLEEEAQIVPSTPEKQSTLPPEAEFIDPEIAPREIRPAIDPKYGDLLPLPPSRPGSPVPDLKDDFPDLPESRPETPEHERHLREIHSHVRRRSAHETPTTRPRTPSQSAVPISFRLGHRHTPSNGRSSPLASPIVGNSEIGSETRSRSRPISWEGAREFKPLLLLQRASRGSIGSVGSLEISSSPERESPLRDVSPSESEIHEHRSQSLRRLLAESPDRNQSMRDNAFTTPTYTAPGVSTPSEPVSAFEATHFAENLQIPDDGAVKSSHESTHQRDIELDDHHLEPVPEQPILEDAEDAEVPLSKPEPAETAYSMDELSPLTEKRPSDINFPPSPSTTAATHERMDLGETAETPLERSVEVVVPKIEMTEPTPRESELPTTHDDDNLNQESEFLDSLEAQDKDMLSSHLYPETEASKSFDTLHTALSHFEDSEIASLSEQAPQDEEKPQETKLIEAKDEVPPEVSTNVEVAQIREEPRRTSKILEQLRAARKAKESTPVEKSIPVNESLSTKGSSSSEDPKEEVQQTSRRSESSDAKQAAPSPFQSLDQGGWLSSFRSSWRSGLLPRPWQQPKATDNNDNKDKESDAKTSTAAEASSSEPPSLESRELQPSEETSKEITSMAEPEPEPSNAQQDVTPSPKKSKKKKKRKSQVVEPSPDQPVIEETQDASLDKATLQTTEIDQSDLIVPRESLNIQPIATDTRDTLLGETLAEPIQDSQPGPVTQEPLEVESVVMDTHDADLNKLPTHLSGNDQPDIQSDVNPPQESLDVQPITADTEDVVLDNAFIQPTVGDQSEDQPDAEPPVQSDVIIPEESLNVQPNITDTRDTSSEKAFVETTGDDKPGQSTVQPDILPDVQPDILIPQESLDVQPVLTDAQATSLDEAPTQPTKDSPYLEPPVESDVQPNIQPDAVTLQDSLEVQPDAADTQDTDLDKTFTQQADDNPSDTVTHQQSLDIQPDLVEEVPVQEEAVVTEEPADIGKELSVVGEAPALELGTPINEPLSKLELETEPIATESKSSIVETETDAQPTISTTEPEAALPELQIAIKPENLAPQPEPSILEGETVTTEPEPVAIEPIVSAIEDEPTRSEPEAKEADNAGVEAKETTIADLEVTGVEKEIPPVETESTIVESEIPSSKLEPIVELEPTTVEGEPVIAEQVAPIAETEQSIAEVAPSLTEKELTSTKEKSTAVEDEIVEPPTAPFDSSSSVSKKEKKKKKKKAKKQQSSENDQDEPATPLEESVQLADQPTEESKVERSDVLPVDSQTSTQDQGADADTLDASLDKTPAQLDQTDVAGLDESHDAQPSLADEVPSTPKKSKKKKKGKKAQTSEPEPEAATAGEQILIEEEKSQPLSVEVPSLPVVQEAETASQLESHRPRSPLIGDVEVLADHTEIEHQPIPPAEEKLARENVLPEEPQTLSEFSHDKEGSLQSTSPNEPDAPVSTEPTVDNIDGHQPILPSDIEPEETALATPQPVVEEVQLPSETVEIEEATEFSIPHEDPRTEQQHDGQHTLMETSSESPVAQDPKSLEQVNVDESSLQPSVLLGGEHARDPQVPASIAPLEAPLSGPNSTEALQEKSPEQIEVAQEPSAENLVVDEPQSSNLPIEPIVEQPHEMALPQEESDSKRKGKNKVRQDTSESVDIPVDIPADTGIIQEPVLQVTPSETTVDEPPTASEVQEKPSQELTDPAGDDLLPEPTKSSKKSKKSKKKRQKSDVTDLVNEPEAPKADVQVPEPIPIQDNADATVTTEPIIESTAQPKVVAQVAEEQEQAKDFPPIPPSENQESVPPTEELVQPSEKSDDIVQATSSEEVAEPTQVEKISQSEEPSQLAESIQLEEPIQVQEPVEEPPQSEPFSNVERSLVPEELAKVEESTISEEFMRSEPTLEAFAKIDEVELPNETAGDVIQDIDSENQAGPKQIDEPSKLDESLQPTESTEPETSEVSKSIADQVELVGDNALPQDGSSKKSEEESKETRQAIDAPALTDEPESSKSVEELTAVEPGVEDRQIVDDFRLPTSDLGPATGDQLEEAQAPEPESTPSKKQATKDKKKKKKRGSVQNESVANDIPEEAPQASDAQPSASNEVVPQIETPADVEAITEDTQANEGQDETADKGLKFEESKFEEEQQELPTGIEEISAPSIATPEISTEPSTVLEEAEQSKKEGLEPESTPTTPKKSKKDKKKKKRQSVQLAEPPEQSMMETPTQPDEELPKSGPAFDPDQASLEISHPPDFWSKPEGSHDDKSGDASSLPKPETGFLQDEVVDPSDQPTHHVESEQKSDAITDEGDKLEPQDTNVPAILEDVEASEPKDQLPVETLPNDSPDDVQQHLDEVLPTERQNADIELPLDATDAQEPTAHDESRTEIVQPDQDVLPTESSPSEAIPPRDETEQPVETQGEADVAVIPQADEPTPTAPIDVEDDQSREQKQVDTQPILEETPTTVADAASPEDTLPEVSTPKKKSKKKKKRASQVDLEPESATATPAEPQEEELQTQPALPEEAPPQQATEQPESQPIVEEPISTKEEIPETLPLVSPSKKSKKERRKAKKLAEAEAEAANAPEPQGDLQVESGLAESAGGDVASSHTDQPTELPIEQPSEQSTEQLTEPMKPISEVDLPTTGTISENIQEENLQPSIVEAGPPPDSGKDHVADPVENIEGETAAFIDQEQSLPKSDQDLIIPPEPENAAKDIPTEKVVDQPDQPSEPIEHVGSNQESDIPIIESDKPDSHDINTSEKLEESSTHLDKDNFVDATESIDEVTTAPVESEKSPPKSSQDSIVPLEPENVAKDIIVDDAANATIEAKGELSNDATKLPTTILEENKKEPESLDTPKLDNQELSQSDLVSRDVTDLKQDEIATGENPLVIEEQQPVEPSDIPEPSKTSEANDVEKPAADQDTKPDVTVPNETESQPSSPVSRKKSKRDKKKKRASIQAESESVSGTQTPSNQETILSGEPNATNTIGPLNQEPVETKPNEVTLSGRP
ncbi:hypothetical protein F4805DRAFT_100996 [Annulohypoxylon moriforme]|nr:hypothetical protein F4805DRAFT_100996 [Annulohypoxylon moriforme]